MKYDIKLAQPADWGWVKPLLLSVKASAPYKDVPLNELDMKRTFKMATKSRSGLCLVVIDKKKKVHGILMGQILKNWWGARVANELVTYSEVPGTTHKLIKKYRQWAIDNGADVITMVNSSGDNERYEKLISRLGFEKAGGVYMHMRTE